MENDKYNFLRVIYIEIQGDKEEVPQHRDDILDGKRKMVITTKESESSPTTPVKLTEENLKKFLN